MYSVMHDRLIPVVFSDGSEGMCSIRDLFLHAHEIRDVKAYSDQARYATIRLLCAFLMDAYSLEDSYDRDDLIEAGHFDIGTIDTYVSACEREGPRFELFDSARPFMQCAYEEATDAKAEKPVAVLIPEYASGNNHLFFMHAGEEEHALAPSEAFQGLLVAYLFCTASVQGYPSSINNTPPVYVLVEGGNLFGTLAMNSLSRDECEVHQIPYGRGEVPWRVDETIVPKKRFLNVSLLQAFTWQPRRITLKLNRDTGMVDRVNLQQGHNFTGNDLWRDPHVPRFQKKDLSYANLKPELGRALWRDAGTLVCSDRKAMPLSIATIADSLRKNGFQRMELSLTGLVTSQASILGASCERLAMPLHLMEDESCARRFYLDLMLIEEAQRVLTRTITARIPIDIARQVQETFLQHMHDILFGWYLVHIQEIASVDEPEDRLSDLIKRFDEELLAGLRTALICLANLCGTDARSLVLQVAIERIVIGWYYNQKKGREGE